MAEKTDSYLKQWIDPSVLVHLLTVVICLVLAWGNVTNRIDNAEADNAEQAVEINEIRKITDQLRMDAQTDRTVLERRFADMRQEMNSGFNQLNTKLEKLITQNEKR